MKKISYTFYALLGLLVCANLTQAQVNLNDGLVVYLPLDNNRLDFSGNNNHGAASGGTGFTADRFGNANSAASFGGTSNGGRITITHNASLVFTTGATFSCWARVNSAIGTFGNGNVGSGGSQCIFAKAGDAGGGFWQLARFENGGLTNQIGNNSVSALTGAIQPYTLGTWFHYVVTMDATGHKIYVNGVLQSENTIPANLTAMNNRNIGIGRFISNWYPLNGAVDEFRVHNRVLNMDEITALANDDLISISATYAGPSAVCAGADVTVNYTSTGDFAANNTFTLQLSNASGSFANPIFTAQLASSNNSGSFTVTIPEVAASGTGYRFRILSSAPNSISDTTSTFSVTGFVNTIPDPSLYEYIGSVGGNHYYLSNNVTTWHQAQIQALANGGHLAIVPNAQTNTLLANSMATGGAYIGLTDEVTEGTFLWVDGSQLTYSSWNAGEPNNVGGVEHYVALNSNGTWNDTPGGNGRSFMQLSLAGMGQHLCLGAPIQLNAVSIPNATYSWTGPNGFSSNSQNPSIANAGMNHAGTYNLTITSQGCSVSASTNINLLLTPNNLGGNSPLPASLSSGLQLHYLMDGDAQDASGNNIHGTMVGGVTPALNRFGEENKSLQFNGTNGHITVPSAVHFDGSDFTVTAWVRRVSNTNWSRLFDFGNGPNSDNILLALSSGTTGRPVISIRQGGTIVGEHASPTAFANNQWVHLTYTWSNNVGALRVNGNVVASGTQQAPLNVVRAINYIGRSNFSTDAFANARFDDLECTTACCLHMKFRRSCSNNPTH